MQLKESGTGESPDASCATSSGQVVAGPKAGRPRLSFAERNGLALLVCGVLAFAAVIIIPGFLGATPAAMVALTDAMISSGINGTLDMFRMQVGRYPTTKEGLSALVRPTGAGWRGPYVGKANQVRDAWGNPLSYACPGTHNTATYDLWSFGPNGVDEGGGGDDIVNWK